MERWTIAGLDCLRQIPRVTALAEMGRTEEAATLLDTLVGDRPVELTFGMLVPDIGWVEAPRLCCPTALAEACCLLGDRRRAALLYDALLPSAELHVGSAPFLRGAVARYLGQMATVLGRHEEADAHFRLAHRLHDAMDAPLWSAHGRLDHGRMLAARDRPGDRQRAAEMLAEARDRFEALGMEFYRRRAAALLERTRPTSSTASVRHEDGQWAFVYEGRPARLRDGKGVRFLVRLLLEPGREIHCVELAGGGEGAQEAEKARQSVTRALKSTVDRLHATHPALAAHLRAALRVGVYSAYLPDPRAPMIWDG
jgi:tetratricopeptide (TPR) repeat protein